MHCVPRVKAGESFSVLFCTVLFHSIPFCFVSFRSFIRKEDTKFFVLYAIMKCYQL